MTKKLSKKPDLKELEELLGSKERTLFYLTWLKHNRNAKQAYLELHPEVTERSAEVLGSRMLSNIEMKQIARAYGLDEQAYFEQLAKGLIAKKRDQFSGELEEDHKTRKPYHDKLGEILGIEGKQTASINVQVNNLIQKEAKEYDLDE